MFLGCCRCVSTLLDVLQILAEHPNIVMDENFAGGDGEEPAEPAPSSEVRVWGNIAAFVERLDDELFKSLQVRFSGCCTAHSLTLSHFRLEP